MPSPAAPTFASAERERTSSRLDKGKSELPELALDLGTDLDLDILRRPSVLIDDIIATGGLTDSARATSPARPSPLTPAPRYPGWVSEVVAPLAGFIDEAIDPRSLFGDLREIGEGESGSVYAARVIVAPPSASGSAQGSREQNASYVAIKNVPLLPNGSPKLVDLQRELSLMKNVRHENVLSMEAVYVDLVEDGLWIKMELMELSLADVLMLAEEGIVMEEKSIARCTRDILQALSYLQSLGIAHRDLRSDNLLVNREGVVKIADFSSAVQVSRDEPIRSDPAGVIYWQPPEMRMGSYNALKVDVWSLGATVWEMAQAEPPFSDLADPQQMAYRWPPLSQPNMYSRSFHDFLDSCSQPSSLRPNPDELLKTSFVRSASGRQAVVQLLAECRAIEGRIARRQSADSDGTVSVS
ncbi:kinase-like protein [Wolfiporia cocos MD-104 SS10]|uniref:Kinase-like protein n=1 Tax=Wolfiporia cocos (strain MD-104) TaxID=742152 RepID=A0A2H3JT39_WOLCO|nr:kinase-like protein [Wolfiporia cocos MD-104 SS10]